MQHPKKIQDKTMDWVETIALPNSLYKQSMWQQWMPIWNERFLMMEKQGGVRVTSRW